MKRTLRFFSIVFPMYVAKEGIFFKFILIRMGPRKWLILWFLNRTKGWLRTLAKFGIPLSHKCCCLNMLLFEHNQKQPKLNYQLRCANIVCIFVLAVFFLSQYTIEKGETYITCWRAMVPHRSTYFPCRCPWQSRRGEHWRYPCLLSGQGVLFQVVLLVCSSCQLTRVSRSEVSVILMPFVTDPQAVVPAKRHATVNKNSSFACFVKKLIIAIFFSNESLQTDRDRCSRWNHSLQKVVEKENSPNTVMRSRKSIRGN